MKKMPMGKTSYPTSKGPNYSKPKGDALLLSLSSVAETCENKEHDFKSNLLAKTLKMLVSLIDKPTLLDDLNNHLNFTSPCDVFRSLTDFGLDEELAEQTVRRLTEIHKESKSGLFQQTR